MTKLIVTFRKFVKTPEIKSEVISYTSTSVYTVNYFTLVSLFETRLFYFRTHWSLVLFLTALTGKASFPEFR
jgi:hypothetical protein